MTARLRASLIVIGDEILGGFVRDANSGFLAGRLQELGVPLDRVVTVPDEHAAIDEALSAELARARPRLVVTSGGIGSTPDDLTLEAVAASLGVDLAADPAIDARITRALEWRAAQGVSLDASHDRAMRRMALVPKGAYLIADDGGFAAGVAVDVDEGCGSDGGATVVILPGVPSEFQRITRNGIEPVLIADRGHPEHVEELSHGYPESMLNPVFERVLEEFPGVRLGSYPGRECTVRLKGERADVEAAMAVVRGYLDELDSNPAAARLQAAWQSHWG
ncbi:MAG TPA: molybdopterin-binding protein [Egibacteraceae bacterium]|nr:molybdopterin-binding protein [Egibacteraceae bacterium]